MPWSRSPLGSKHLGGLTLLSTPRAQTVRMPGFVKSPENESKSANAGRPVRWHAAGFQNTRESREAVWGITVDVRVMYIWQRCVEASS
jgi:hypothetical protein